MANRTFALMASAAIPAFVFLAAPALAQDTAQGAKESGIRDIIVTAQKREERLQDVPIAITAIGSEALAKANVNSIADMSRIAIPGLVSTSFVGTQVSTFNIRGISSQDASVATIEAPIAIYVDGVYLPRFIGLGGEIVEVERVEVLRGPQGTLFGRNAEGGAVSIVSKKPTGEFGGSIGGEVANFGRYKGHIHLNLPEVANVSTKIDAYFAKSDGYTKNGPNDAVSRVNVGKTNTRNFGQQNDWGVRGQLLWQPSDSFTALLAADYSDLKDANLYMHFDTATPIQPGVPGGYVEPVEVGTYVKRTPFSWYIPYVETKVKGAQLTLTYDVSDNVTVKSITAARGVQERGGNNLQAYLSLPSFFFGRADPPGTFLSGLVSSSFVKSKSFSQEVQLLGSTDTVEYVVGAFYFRENADDQRGNSLTLLAKPGQLPQAIAPINIGTDNSQSVRSSTFALFAQATWTPGGFDDKLKITPGLRYTEASKSGVRTKFAGQVLANPIRRQIPSISRIDPALTIAYDVAEDVNLYLRYAQAFRDGGATVRSPTFSTFGAESNRQVEFGVKSDLFDRKVRLNMAVYHSWVKDQQISVTPKEDTTAQEIVNVPGTTRLWGLEGELTVAPAQGLLIGANFSFMRGSQPAYDCGLVPVAAGGCIQTITFLPKTSLGANIDYSVPVGDSMEAFFHADYKYTSNFHTSPKSFPSLGEVWPPSHFNVANVRIGVDKIPLGSVRGNISAYVDNVFDNQNVVFDTNVKFQTIQLPRRFGVALSVDF